MIEIINNFFTKYEGLWLFIILLIGLVYENRTYYWVKREYIYDERKDIEKKQRKTKTMKKTTTQPGGASIIEESTETVEGVPEHKEGESK
jgi:hypothetical protein